MLTLINKQFSGFLEKGSHFPEDWIAGSHPNQRLQDAFNTNTYQAANLEIQSGGCTARKKPRMMISPGSKETGAQDRFRFDPVVNLYRPSYRTKSRSKR